MADKQTVARYRENLQSETDGAALYRALSEAETDPDLKQVFARLAGIEEAHAEFWRRRLAEIGVAAGPEPRPSWRVRALGWLARRFGPQFVLPAIAAQERRDSRAYDLQPEAVARGFAAAEHGHALLIGAAASAAPKGLPGATLARLEGRHRGVSGNALRAAVLGANDGLVSNLSLVMGVAGAQVPSETILLTGLAGLVAGAGSMAMGEWLSVTSSRELAAGQIASEAAEFEAFPAEEREELVLIYRSKGMSETEAQALADRVMADPKLALDALAREELGVDPEELGGSAWAAAGSSFLLFMAGAIVPVLPFLLLTGTAAIVGSLVLSGAALLVIGAATALMTGRGVLFSALRQFLIGLAAAGLTYGAGALVGASLG
ncbi:MAG: VIT1/CCC1 transporter family protein [Acetobacteraceae bacterium]|nr:VIT1/CCC1 transporter family protein [Acetobacteraceae bacterium]